MNAVNRAAKKLSKKEKSGLTLHFRRAKIFLVTIEQAVVAELADAHGSGPCGLSRGGSTPLNRILFITRPKAHGPFVEMERSVGLFYFRYKTETVWKKYGRRCVAWLQARICFATSRPERLNIGKPLKQSAKKRGHPPNHGRTDGLE